MNEKERIINLVEQGVLTMEEALELIEASVRQPVYDNKDETESNNQVNQEESVDESAETADLEQRLQVKLKTVRQSLKKNEEALKITEQRLREIEIYSELEELPADMVDQQTELKEKEKTLTAEQEDLLAQEIMLQDKLAFHGWSEEPDLQDTIKDQFERAKETTQEFSRTAASEGRNIVKSIAGGVQNLIDNFTTKNVTINVPWIKSAQFSYKKEIDGKGLKNIKLDLLSGDLTITTHDQPHVYLDCELTVYGRQDKTDDTSAEALEDQLPLALQREEDRLTIAAESMKIGIDGTIYLPRHDYDNIDIDLVEGDLVLNQFQANQLIIDHPAGKIDVDHLKVKDFQLESVNGTMNFSNNEIEVLDIENVNGAITLKDSVRDTAISSINSDITVTKTDETPADIKLNTLNGTVRVSVPYQTNLEVKAKVLAGKVFHRLKGLGKPLSTKSFNGSLTHDESDAPLVKMNVDVTNGKIMLKHNNIEQ